MMYPDPNNLYGWTMSQNIPYGKFRWIKNIDYFDINSMEENSPMRLYS